LQGYLVDFQVSLWHFQSLFELERDLLATWIHIMLLIWIREDPLQIMGVIGSLQGVQPNPGELKAH
jgi:hypothetical protein